MKYIIDRIEEGFAVLESADGETENVELSLIYDGAKEGDSVLYENGVYTRLPEETENRKDSIKSRFAKISRRKCKDKEGM